MPRWMVVAALIATPAIAVGQRAEAPSAAPEGLDELERLAEELGSADATVRQHAFDALTTLPEDRLPAIDARLQRLRRGRPPTNWVIDVLNRFRRQGTGAEGEAPDLARGALAELGETHRSEVRRYVLRMAEPVLLWRSLDRMGTFEADQTAYWIVGLDEGQWMAEARNWTRRRGVSVMPAAIAARGSDDRFVRRWSNWATEFLAADDPGRAVQSLDEKTLADTLRAYAMVRVQSAMRIIVSYADSDRRRLRHAARWAMEQYGGNAIWILRTAYHTETGEDAQVAWGWRRLTEELYARVDARLMARVRTALDQGLAARAEGDLATMAARFDDVLARTPETEDASLVAAGYADLGAVQLADHDFAGAERSYRRAARIAPGDAHSSTWRAAVELARSERALSQGILLGDGYERVLEDAPGQPLAIAALARAAPSESADPADRRVLFAYVAAALLLLMGLSLLTVRARRDPVAPAPEESSPTLDGIPGFDAADATLPDA